MLATEKFGQAYDPSSGIVRFSSSKGHLRSDWAEVIDQGSRNGISTFFKERNPGHIQGDELCCLCELSSSNLKPLARRLFEKDLRGSTAFTQEDKLVAAP